MSEPRIVVVGSSNTDMIIRVEHIPREGETLLGGEFATAAGGKGANQAVSAARAGGKVSLIARVGGDMFGERALAGFQAAGIDVRHVKRDAKSPSGVALILVGQAGENSIAVAGGANNRLSSADVRSAARCFSGAQLLLVQLETPLPTVRSAVLLAAARKVRVILNPAPARALPRLLLRHVSILTPNETEAELLTGIKVHGTRSAAKAATLLREMGVATVIITLGANGVLVADAHGTRHVAGFRVRAVDTTAAGDVFNGALAVALAEERPLPDAVRFASAAAAISVTRRGAQPSAPTRRDIDDFLKRR